MENQITHCGRKLPLFWLSYFHIELTLVGCLMTHTNLLFMQGRNHKSVLASQQLVNVPQHIWPGSTAGGCEQRSPVDC